MGQMQPAEPRPPEVHEEDDEVETVTQETARKAQRVVAAHAEDTADCIMLLDMLGVGPHSTV